MNAPPESRPVVRAAALAVLATGALSLAGRALPIPRLGNPAEVAAWAARVGPVVAAFTALRALGCVLLAWFIVTTALGVLGRRRRLPRLTRVVDRLSTPTARRLADIVAGTAVVVASFGPASVAGADARPGLVATLVATPATSAGDGDVATMRYLGPSPTDDRQSVAPPVVPATWTIQPGDHLWHVSESVLTSRYGHAPTPADTARYLEALVTANTDRLAVPGQPDLVFPGQEFVLPGP